MRRSVTGYLLGDIIPALAKLVNHTHWPKHRMDAAVIDAVLLVRPWGPEVRKEIPHRRSS
ncbi:hypothetical protein GCM10009578_042130 [Streptomyces rhizosphaericus]